MIIIEGNSRKHPCSTRQKQPGEIYITSKVPSENTDILCARHIDWRLNYEHLPFMCYKWMESKKHPEIKKNDVWVANYTYWDDYFLQFDPKFRDPSVGTCAVFCVIERWRPQEIGLIGFDWVLDGNSDWFHDAAAEKKAIEQLVNIIDLRDNNESNTSLRRVRPEGSRSISRL